MQRCCAQRSGSRGKQRTERTERTPDNTAVLRWAGATLLAGPARCAARAGQGEA